MKQLCLKNVDGLNLNVVEVPSDMSEVEAKSFDTLKSRVCSEENFMTHQYETEGYFSF